MVAFQVEPGKPSYSCKQWQDLFLEVRDPVVREVKPLQSIQVVERLTLNELIPSQIQTVECVRDRGKRVLVQSEGYILWQFLIL